MADGAQATLDSLASGGKGLPPTTIMDRLKSSLRKLGYRCQVTLQVWQTVQYLDCCCDQTCSSTIVSCTFWLS